MDCVTYYALIASIPNLWKVLLRHREIGEKTLGIEKLPRGMKWTRFAYWQFVESKHKPEKNAIKQIWERELNLDLATERDNIVMIPFKVSISRKLRFFQYRCLHKKLITNIQASKWKDISTNCSYCRARKETVTHTKWILGTLTKWFERKLKLDRNHQPLFLPEHIAFCNYKGPYKDLENTAIVIVKQYIYAGRCTKIPVAFIEPMPKITEFQRIEKTIAYKNPGLL